MAEQTPQNTSGRAALDPQKDKVHPVKKFFKRVVMFFVILTLLILFGMAFFFTRTRNEGYQAGSLSTFVKSGLLFKTYEGELIISNSNPTVNTAIVTEKWSFSVTDDSVAKVLFALTSKNVKLYYKEKQQSFPWQGDTKRFVEQAEEVK